MPFAQRPCHEHLLDVIRELEQADEVGDARPAAPDGAGHIGLRLPEVLHQDGEGLCCFDGVEILAYEVLDQAHLQALPLVGVAHDRRHLRQASCTGRTPAALARNQLIVALGQRPHHDWLDKPGGGDRFGQGRERVVVDASAGLGCVGAHLVETQHQEARASRIRRGSGIQAGHGDRRVAQQR